MTALNKAATALKLYADGFKDKDSFNTEFMKLFPDFPRSTAGYFSDAFRHHNPGQSQRKGRAASPPKEPKAPKEPKPVKEKVLKKKAEKVVKEKPSKASAPVKSLDEIAKIKAANLARMKAVSEKTKKYTMVAREEGAGVPNFDPEKARAEVATFLDTGDIDSFAAPEKLSADQVRALV